MRFGIFKITSYVLNLNKSSIDLEVTCLNCNRHRKVKLVYDKVVRVKCNQCGKLEVVIPISYYTGTKIVNDTRTIGYYMYRKIKKEYAIDNKDMSEAEFISRILD